jgi:hypothetical protein
MNFMKLGCNATQSVRSLLTFLKNIPSKSEMMRCQAKQTICRKLILVGATRELRRESMGETHCLKAAQRSSEGVLCNVERGDR